MTMQDDSQRAGSLEPQFLEERLRSLGITTSLTRALIRSMGAQGICAALEQCYSDDGHLRNTYLMVLAEYIRDDPKHLAVVRDAVTHFLTLDEIGDFNHSLHAALDATIRRLVALLPAAEQVMLAPQFLLHKRVARRRIGAYIVGSHPEYCLPDMKQTLIQAYEQWHDPQVLAPLSRISSDVSDVAPMLLEAFTKLSGPGRENRCLNEQARVFAHLVRADLPQAMALADDYPTAFVFGVGKARHVAALSQVLDILTKTQVWYETAHRLQAKLLLRKGGWSSVRGWIVQFHANASAERLRLCIWTLGQLRARGALEALAKAYGIQWLEAIHADDHNADEA